MQPFFSMHSSGMIDTDAHNSRGTILAISQKITKWSGKHNMTKNNPVFIIGESKSGKSLLLKHLAIHRNACWFSNFSDRWPQNPYCILLHRLTDIPVLRKAAVRAILHSKGPLIIPMPVEAVNIYHNYCGFLHDRWQTEDDLTGRQIHRFKKTVENHTRLTGKKVFINDQSANIQRIRQIMQIFPDAKWIHIIRDGRAAAYEMSNAGWWPETPVWWWGRKAKVWEQRGHDRVILCALDWKVQIETVLNHTSHLESRLLQVRFEDLVHHTRQTLKKTAVFCGLKPHSSYMRHIASQLRVNTDAWRTALTKSQLEQIDKVIGPLLKKLDYI